MGAIEDISPLSAGFACGFCSVRRVCEMRVRECALAPKSPGNHPKIPPKNVKLAVPCIAPMVYNQRGLLSYILRR